MDVNRQITLKVKWLIYIGMITQSKITIIQSLERL
jgi:hypothetical protein